MWIEIFCLRVINTASLTEAKDLIIYIYIMAKSGRQNYLCTVNIV